MGSRAALPVAVDRGAVLGPRRHRPQEEQLLEGQLSLEDVALGEPRDALDVGGRQDLAMENARRQIGRVASQGGDHRVPEGLALGVVPAAVQGVGRILDEDAHHVLARWCHAGIDHRRDHDVHVRVARELAILRVVVGALQVCEARADRDRSPQVWSDPRQAGQVGQPVERQVHLARGATELVAAHTLDQVVGKLLGLHQLGEREPRIEPRHHDLGRDLLAALERHAGRLAVAGEDALHRGAGADRRAERLGGPRDALADGTRAALLESPGAECAVDLSHVMVEQHVGGAGRARPQEGADDSARRLGGLERIELEPLVEVVGAAHGHELVERVEALGAERAEVTAQPQEAHHVRGGERGRIGGHHAQDRLHRHRHVVHEPPEQHRGVGVVRRMPAQLAPRLVGIRPRGEVVAVVEWGHGAFERQDLQAVARQVQVADDLRSQQAHDVREDRELEPREHLFGHRGSTEQRAPLQHQHGSPRARQVGGGDEPVVTTADHDGVEARGVHERFRS